MSSSLIEDALGHPAKIRVLRTLKKPGAGYMSINRLAQMTALNAVTLARTLRSLQELGLANYIQAGKSQLWRLSEGYAATVIAPILDAMEKSPNIVDSLKDAVLSLPVPSEVQKISLFGSVARGENVAESDIDVFILKNGRTDEESFDIFLNKLTEKISREFWMNPSFLIKTPSEWKAIKPKLKQNISEGIILYEKSPNQRGP